MATTAVNGSTSSPHKHKKRKERPSDSHLAKESHQHKKKKSKDKHRHAELDVAAPEVVSHHVSKKKGKRKMEDGESAFAVVSASIRLSIPPVFAAKPLAGVEEMLDSMVMKHIPSLKGVVLSHSNIQFLDEAAQILNECPFSICNVGFDALVWSPRVGMRLTGQVILFSPDHIALLVNRTFNVSIPARHIPDDEYEFDYQANEVDGPINGVGERNRKVPEEMEGDETLKDSASSQHEPAVDDPQIDAMGRWVKRNTCERVGGPNLMVEFTVVGMILANQMISLIGSLQPDPLDPRHSEVAAPSPGPHPVEPASEFEEEEEELPPPPPPVKKKKKDKKSKGSSGSKPSASRNSDDDLPELPKPRP
ncbi:hypothetical protein M407DRAFT_66977 [Tulasnella calospora MUT 4182]|uniref:RPA43 OB domain-containing protein n=1 Tax=Tulasnella calospora MUT 4182 TaxID=1051891 RepID=A0A0C3QUQ9_9AGAM|nr:hypothetical protein M407DRAFT_66977 [Tulasnella calospora MUT 4182]